MRYTKIETFDIANGEGIGVALFVQGCYFKCKNCFNPETWDFNGGKEWTEEIENKFIELASKPYIKRISLLGGECLADKNVSDVLNLVNKIHLLLPEKTIWLYTGYTWDYIFDCVNTIDVVGNEKRKEILKQCNVLVDGRYEEDKRDITLKWRGSSNQNVIDIRKSLEQNKIVLWCD
jgi:anaerobic ribonucleoside-triphosphate reductase activating protein